MKDKIGFIIVILLGMAEIVVFSNILSSSLKVFNSNSTALASLGITVYILWLGWKFKKIFKTGRNDSNGK